MLLWQQRPCQEFQGAFTRYSPVEHALESTADLEVGTNRGVAMTKTFSWNLFIRLISLKKKHACSCVCVCVFH